MSEQIEKKLLRQLKLINFWISFYGIIMIIVLGVMAYFIFQMVSFVRDTNQRIESLKSAASDSVNVQKQVCEGDSAFSNLLKSQTKLCSSKQK